MLLGFFHYYAWEFDYKRDVVSISGGDSLNGDIADRIHGLVGGTPRSPRPTPPTGQAVTAGGMTAGRSDSKDKDTTSKAAYKKVKLDKAEICGWNNHHRLR